MKGDVVEYSHLYFKPSSVLRIALANAEEQSPNCGAVFAIKEHPTKSPSLGFLPKSILLGFLESLHDAKFQEGRVALGEVWLTSTKMPD